MILIFSYLAVRTDKAWDTGLDLIHSKTYFSVDDKGETVTVTSDCHVNMLNETLSILGLLGIHTNAVSFRQEGMTSHTARQSMGTLRTIYFYMVTVSRHHNKWFGYQSVVFTLDFISCFEFRSSWDHHQAVKHLGPLKSNMDPYFVQCVILYNIVICKCFAWLIIIDSRLDDRFMGHSRVVTTKNYNPLKITVTITLKIKYSASVY
jgi:hypothetical protein